MIQNPPAMHAHSIYFCILFTLGCHTVVSLAQKIGWIHIPRSSSICLKMSIPGPLDTFSSGLASICRFQKGVTAEDGIRPGPKLLQLFDIETSCECRAVRERISELDLIVQAIIPATANSRVFSDSTYLYSLPKGATIPRLIVQENDGNQIVKVGQTDILSYLDETFSTPVPPLDNSPSSKEQALLVTRIAGNYVANVLRFTRGSSVTSAATSTLTPRPQQPLILYSYEGNQFCRLVREVLTELDLVYELRSAAKLSPRRAELAAITGGSSQCPFLIDPNTNTQMMESADIIRYLYNTYALWTPPSELLQLVSETILTLVTPLFQILAPLQAGSYKEDKNVYNDELSKARQEIEQEIESAPVVVYTYDLSPFSSETKALLDNLDIDYEEISLGYEWLPGLIAEGGSQKRAALLQMTGQSSMPHVFVGRKSIGGLFSGTPGLIPALEKGILMDMVTSARSRNIDSISSPSEVDEVGAFE